ncbi:MAG TPA: FxsA family protein [Pirellulaceae bacterium]|nr:FxsA family protein [Pirellulaceae bacterium]
MLFYLLLLFIVVPFVELALLLKLAELTSWLHTLLLVIATGVLGTWLARSQGMRTYRKIQQSLSAGQMPTDSLLDAAMIFVAGALLLTPGMLTDLFGFSLLFPMTRQLYRRWLVQRFKARFTMQTRFGSSEPRQESEIIDSYVVEHHSEPDDVDG